MLGEDVLSILSVTVVCSADASYPDAVSDMASARLWTSWYANFSIDTHAPMVTFPGIDWNGTVRPTNDEVLCLSCGERTNESALGCTILFVINGTDTPTTAPATSTTTASLHTHYANGDRIVLTAWSRDAAGNVGPPSTLTWTIDSLVPVTVWPLQLDSNETFITALTTTEFIMSCSRPQADCFYSYR